jgi:predicted  nucleic acid-binding Zn-ribbon protein
LKDFDDFYSEDTEHLKKQLEKLQFQVDRMENQVVKMEHNLATRRARRNKEASLTNMTPEERAEYVIQQEKEEEEGKQENIPDLDVIL